MDIIILALLAVLIILVIVAIILIIKNKPKADNGISLIDQKIDFNARRTDKDLKNISDQMHNLTEKNYEQMLRINESLNENADKQSRRIGESIAAMQESNEKKLEQMRVTVDEKLTETLNQRLNASFNTVSEQLKNVYESLGEMKKISSDVTGLSRVLTNVKARGTWAEVQLGNILDETIPGMYDTNVQTNPKYNGRVEFAVRIPNPEDDSITYLPIDSKFPMEDYARLIEAADTGNADALEKSKKDLEKRIKAEALDIRKYISPPETTPFAILYLATEGLYAEIISSKSTIAEELQKERIMIAGPSTITALLNSLAMGFRTMAINKKANEVWKVLGAAKEQYGKFGILLQKAKKKIEEAGKTIDEADYRNEQIQKKLRKVETLDSGEANDILGLEE